MPPLLRFTLLAALISNALGQTNPRPETAQSAELKPANASIEGVLTDGKGAVVRGARLRSMNLKTHMQTMCISGNTGEFVLGPLPAGHYDVEVFARGFQRLLQKDVEIDELEHLGIRLKLTPGSESTTITITDGPPIID